MIRDQLKTNKGKKEQKRSEMKVCQGPAFPCTLISDLRAVRWYLRSVGDATFPLQFQCSTLFVQGSRVLVLTFAAKSIDQKNHPSCMHRSFHYLFDNETIFV